MSNGDPEKVSLDKWVDVLLEEKRSISEKLLDIKSEELSWLRIALLFYAGLLAWILSHWFGQSPPPTTGPFDVWGVGVMWGNEILAWLTFILGLVATILFTWLFLRTRWGYYGRKQRLGELNAILAELEEEVSASYAGSAFSSSGDAGPLVTDWKSWWKKTKPLDTFFTRLAYLYGANFVAGVLLWMGLHSDGYCPEPARWWHYLLVLLFIFLVLLFIFLVHVFIFFVPAFVWDYFGLKGSVAGDASPDRAGGTAPGDVGDDD